MCCQMACRATCVPQACSHAAHASLRAPHRHASTHTAHLRHRPALLQRLESLQHQPGVALGIRQQQHRRLRAG